MLHAAPSHPFVQDNLTVMFAYTPRSYLAFMARLAKALDPYGPVPPSLSTISVLATQSIDIDSVRQLNRLMAEVAADSSKLETRLAKLTTGTKDEPAPFAALASLASWLSLGAKVTPVPEYIFRRPDIAGPLDVLCRMDEGFTGPAPKDGCWLSEQEEHALALITLWSSYPRLITSYLTAEEDTPKGSPKEIYPLFKRMQKAMALVLELRLAISLTGLRDRALFLASEVVAPFLQYVSKDVRDDLTAHTSWALGLPMHPWLAGAARPQIAQRRATAFGASNPSFGLASLPADAGLWDKLSQWRKLRGTVGGHEPSDLRDYVLDSGPDGAIKSFVREARELRELRDALDQSFLTSARGTLELMAPSTAPEVHLNGETWTPIVMTGNHSDVAISDPWALLLRCRFSLTDDHGDTGSLVGSAASYDFDAGVWNSGKEQKVGPSSTIAVGVTPPLYVLPTRAQIAEEYSLGLLIPEQLRPRTSGEYFGDTDAITIPYSAAALAAHLGYENADAMRTTKGLLSRLGHLFTYDDGTRQWLPAREATYIFHSSRTEEPWRKPVMVPTALVSSTVALDMSTAPVTGGVRAVLFRTRDYPIMQHSTFTLADSLAAMAAAGLGYRKA